MQLLCNKYISVEMCFFSHYKKYCIVVCNYHCVATRSESMHFYSVAFILESDTFFWKFCSPRIAEGGEKMAVKTIEYITLRPIPF